MRPLELRDFVVAALDELKGRDIVALGVTKLTDVTDYMVVANGTSNRHVSALIDHLVHCAKAAGIEILGVEGRESMEWVLLDLGDVVVHVMQTEARGFYDLERLWTDLSDDATAQEPPDAERNA